MHPSEEYSALDSELELNAQGSLRKITRVATDAGVKLQRRLSGVSQLIGIGKPKHRQCTEDSEINSTALTRAPNTYSTTSNFQAPVDSAVLSRHNIFPDLDGSTGGLDCFLYASASERKPCRASEASKQDFSNSPSHSSNLSTIFHTGKSDNGVPVFSHETGGWWRRNPLQPKPEGGPSSSKFSEHPARGQEAPSDCWTSPLPQINSHSTCNNISFEHRGQSIADAYVNTDYPATDNFWHPAGEGSANNFIFEPSDPNVKRIPTLNERLTPEINNVATLPTIPSPMDEMGYWNNSAGGPLNYEFFAYQNNSGGGCGDSDDLMDIQPCKVQSPVSAEADETRYLCPWPQCKSKADKKLTHLRRTHIKARQCPNPACRQRSGDKWTIRRHMRSCHKGIWPQKGIPQTESEVNHYQEALLKTFNTYDRATKVAICSAQSLQELRNIPALVELRDTTLSPTSWRAVLKAHGPSSNNISKSNSPLHLHPSLSRQPTQEMQRGTAPPQFRFDKIHEIFPNFLPILDDALSKFNGMPDVGPVKAVAVSVIIAIAESTYSKADHSVCASTGEYVKHLIHLAERYMNAPQVQGWNTKNMPTLDDMGLSCLTNTFKSDDDLDGSEDIYSETASSYTMVGGFL